MHGAAGLPVQRDERVDNRVQQCREAATPERRVAAHRSGRAHGADVHDVAAGRAAQVAVCQCGAANYNHINETRPQGGWPS